jgi:hypothetical protein
MNNNIPGLDSPPTPKSPIKDPKDESIAGKHLAKGETVFFLSFGFIMLAVCVAITLLLLLFVPFQ